MIPNFLILWTLLASYSGLTGGTCPAGIASYIGNKRILDGRILILAGNNGLEHPLNTHDIDRLHLNMSSFRTSH